MIENELQNLYFTLTDEEYKNTWEKYHARKYPEIFLLNGLPFHFDVDAKSICVSFSGGADSAILTIMLCELIKNLRLDTKIHVITMIRFNETKPWLAKGAEELYQHIKELYPNIISDQHWGFIPTELEPIKLSDVNNNTRLVDSLPIHATFDAYITAKFEEYILKKYKIDWSYSGITMNPPLDLPKAPKFRDKEFVKGETARILQRVFVSPFALLNKNFTIAQYKNYNVEYLLSMTRSCEADYLDLGQEYLHNNQMPPVCGKCFFCKERQWAIDNQDVYLKENL